MTKQQTDYLSHNADDLTEGWAAVSTYVDDCVLIAFDGCHKIYLAMDETEAYSFRTNEGYESVIENNGDNNLMDILDDWYDISCPLKFINAVWTSYPDANDGYVSLISQCAGDAPEDDEEEV